MQRLALLLALTLSACSLSAEQIAAPFQPAVFECAAIEMQVELGYSGSCAIAYVTDPVPARWIAVEGDDLCEAPRVQCLELLPGQDALGVGEPLSAPGASVINVRAYPCGTTCASLGLRE